MFLPLPGGSARSKSLADGDAPRDKLLAAVEGYLRVLCLDASLMCMQANLDSQIC